MEGSKQFKSSQIQNHREMSLESNLFTALPVYNNHLVKRYTYDEKPRYKYMYCHHLSFQPVKVQVDVEADKLAPRGVFQILMNSTYLVLKIKNMRFD